MTKNYRRCVSCRKIAPKSEFWRVVKCNPSTEIAIDIGHHWLQGRSAYICQTGSCLQIAQKKNQLGKSLRAQVCPEIYQQLTALTSVRVKKSLETEVSHH
jgi:uncharacterized protein